MRKPLKISVVTVCYNAAKTLEETLISVLNQTYDNVEYIIIDGGSTDGTVDIIKKYIESGSEYGKYPHTVSYWISEPDNGIYFAMKKGIAIATGDYINFMNAGDTFLEKNTLELVQKGIPEFLPAVVYGQIIKLNENKFREAPKNNPFFQQRKRIKSPGICHQSIFVLFEEMKKYGFNTSFKIAADYYLMKQIYENGGIFYELDLPVAIYDTSGVSSIKNFQRLKEFAAINGLNPDSIRVKLHIIIYYLKRVVKEIIRYGN